MILMKWQYNNICQFVIVFYSPFQNDETLETWHNWLLSNLGWLLNWKGSGNQRQSFKLFKRFQENIDFAYIYQLAKIGDLMSCGSKDIFKSASCTNTWSWHHRFGKSWDAEKYNNLNTLRTEHEFSMKQKNSEPVLQMAYFEKLLFCSRGNL